MSILKAILHRWNKTTKSYETIHPETESAQITDWHSGIMSSLASKTLGTVVDAITTDSVLGKLIKMLLNASGVKYLIADNGYICFGEYFGGLIIQWGYGFATNSGYLVSFPISFLTMPASLAIAILDTNTNQTNNYRVSYNSLTNNDVIFYTTTTASIYIKFIAIGK